MKCFIIKNRKRISIKSFLRDGDSLNVLRFLRFKDHLMKKIKICKLTKQEAKTVSFYYYVSNNVVDSKFKVFSSAIANDKFKCRNNVLRIFARKLGFIK